MDRQKIVKMTDAELEEAIKHRQDQLTQLADSFHWNNRNKCIRKERIFKNLEHNLRTLEGERGRRAVADRLSGKTLPKFDIEE